VLVLERTYERDRTTGILHAHYGWSFETLELPWRQNMRNVSCIPEARYSLHRDEFGTHQWYRLDDDEVHPRSAIELHPAARVDQLKGCIGAPRRHLYRLLGQVPEREVLWIRSDTGVPT
jgi:hypothetical protein